MNLRHLCGVFAVLLALAGAASAAAQSSAPTATESHCDLSVQRADFAAARATLLAEPEADDPPTEVAPGAKAALARYKAALAALVAARMECASPEQKPEALAAALDRAAAPAACDAACAEHAYAGAPEFHATRIDDTRHLLALTATLPIPCGSDAMLFVYARAGARWHEALRWQAPPYDLVSGAYGSFEYAIAPADAHGDWYVAVKDIPPWCSSTWASVRYAALRVSSDAQQPKILYRGSDSIWWGGGDSGNLKAEADAFDLRFHSSSLDAGVHNRVWVRRFAVDGNDVKRIPPLAENARDFVDEWIVMRWGSVAPWTADDPAAALQQWHERVRGSDNHVFADFRSAHACDGRADAVEVEIERDSPDVNQDGMRYFLRVEGTPLDFKMVRVDTESDPRCGGDDLLPTLGAP